MDVKQLKDDVQAGRIGLERLVDLIEAQQRQLRETQRQLEEANRLIAELEKKLGPQATNKVEGAFSVQAEEKRQAARGKIKRKRNRPARRGRVTTAEKVRRAERTERCYPAGVAESECWLSHTRPVWRLEDGRAVLIA